jgi:hypothetical protein
MKHAIVSYLSLAKPRSVASIKMAMVIRPLRLSCNFLDLNIWLSNPDILHYSFERSVTVGGDRWRDITGSTVSFCELATIIAASRYKARRLTLG